MQPHRNRVRRGGRAGPASDPLEGLLAGLRLALNRVLRRVHGVAEIGDPEAEEWQLLRVADLEAVARLARYHGVVELFVHGMEGRPALATTSVGDLQRLGVRRLDRAGRLLRSLMQASDTLGDVGVEHLVLKGTTLSQRLYGHPWMRASVDVDLLVPRQAIWRAERALLGAGWSRPSKEEAGGPGTAFQRYLKHRVVIGPDGPVELHRQMVSNPFFLDTPFEELWARRETVRLGSASFATLGATDDCLFNACHGLRHGWRRLKWLCDAAVALRLAAADPATLDQLRQRFRGAGLEAALESVALLCREHLHVATPLSAGRRAAFVASRTGRAWGAPTLKGSADKAWHKASALLLRRGVRPAVGELAAVAAVRLAPFANRPRVAALRSFVRVPFATKGMALEAAFFLATARVLVHYVPWRRWRHWIKTSEGEQTASAVPSPDRRIPPAVQPLPRKVGRIVRRVAAGVPFEAVCLPQALAAQWMLRRRGVASRLSFGFRRPDAELELHAWLTSEGKGVVGHGEAETYCELPSFDELATAAQRAPHSSFGRIFASKPRRARNHAPS